MVRCRLKTHGISCVNSPRLKSTTEHLPCSTCLPNTGIRKSSLVAKNPSHYLMTIPFGETSRSDGESGSELTTPRLRHWLDSRLKHLARLQRIQDARSLRSEFSIEESSRR